MDLLGMVDPGVVAGDALTGSRLRDHQDRSPWRHGDRGVRAPNERPMRSIRMPQVAPGPRSIGGLAAVALDVWRP